MKKNLSMTIRRLMSVYVLEHEGEKQPQMVASMLKNVQDLGFTFSGNLFSALLTQTPEFLTSFYQDFVSTLKALVGTDKKYAPMYPNFPKQVMEADDAELVVNALVHYFSVGTLIPDYPKEAHFPLIGEYPLKVIDTCTEEEIMHVFTNLLASNVPLSKQDKEDVEWFVRNTEYRAYLPDDIPMKETKAYFGCLMIQAGDTASARKLYKTATDVLRLIAAMSGQDVSLSDRIRIRKMKRSERRFIMNLLAACGSIDEDMFRYRALWVKVGEIVHPGEFSSKIKYDRVVKAFDLIREDKKPLYFAGQVEAGIMAGDWKHTLDLLKKRPGEFARRLDQILRINGTDVDLVVQSFSDVSKEVSTRVLWQMKAHFDHRCEDQPRAFFPKGSDTKSHVVENKLPKLPKETCEAASKACYDAIVKQYTAKPAMGAVYIDPALSKFAAPFTNRSASSGFKQLARGTRLPIGADAKVIRPFVWWTNTEDKERIDIDLSAGFLDKNWKCIGHISWTNLRSGKLNAVHSGDIVNGGPFGGNGVCEFIDFDPKQVLHENVRYVIVQVYAYTNQSFSKLPCSFGWMERSDVMSGEVFEPKTVQNNIAISVNSTVAVPIIIDCKTREVIWADMALSGSIGRSGNTLESNLIGSTATAWAIANWTKPSLYDLILANATARGKVVETREEADIIFSNDPTKPMVKIIERDEDGKEVVKEVERAVEVKDAYDLAFYMGEML